MPERFRIFSTRNWRFWRLISSLRFRPSASCKSANTFKNPNCRNVFHDTSPPESRRYFSVRFRNVIHATLRRRTPQADNQFIPFFPEFCRTHDVFYPERIPLETPKHFTNLSVSSAIQHPHCANVIGPCCPVGFFRSSDLAIIAGRLLVKTHDSSPDPLCAHQIFLTSPLAFFRTEHNRVRVSG